MESDRTDEDFNSEFDTGVEEEVDTTPVQVGPKGPQRIAAPTPTQHASDMVDDLGFEATDQPDDVTKGDSDYMLEVDQRLEVATYYRELLRTPLFDQDTTASRIVEREHRAFIRERLEILLSIRAEKAIPVVQQVVVEQPKQFSDEEAEGLKILIAQMRKKGMISQQPAAALTQAPAAAPPEPVRPTVRRAIAPAAPVAPTPRPAPTQVTRTPTQAPPATQPATPAPVKRKPGRPARAVVIEKEVTHPETGDTITIKSQLRQNPAGAIPFPSDIGAATHMQAATQVSNPGISGGATPSSEQNAATILNKIR